MGQAPPRWRRWLPLIGGGAAVAVLALAAAVFWGDVMRTTLDPKVPFQTYRPPRAPDYAQASSWYLSPTHPGAAQPGDPPADVFFVSPTTYAGGRDWNAPIDDAKADRNFRRAMAPNYAGPFVRVGRLFAPRYRQASLYSLMNLREDAREARQFAYADVARAFRAYRDHDNQGRPFFIVGVEQGGALAARLIAEEIAPDPALKARLAAAYLIETVVPADRPPLPPCMKRGETGCLAAWASVPDGELDRAKQLLDRALVWGASGELVNLGNRPALCFNPILGAETNDPAPVRLNLGAANATDLEWGVRPPFLTRQVSAQCREGVLRVSEPRSASLRPTGNWVARRKVPGFNLFYADLENDARGRLLSRP